MKKTQLALPAPQPESAPEGLQSWALVELFGHQRIVGKITVDPVEFPGMVRVDVPDLIKDGKVERKGLTRYIGRNSIYGVTPITEELVRKMLPHVDGTPAQVMSIGSYSRNEDEWR